MKQREGMRKEGEGELKEEEEKEEEKNTDICGNVDQSQRTFQGAGNVLYLHLHFMEAYIYENSSSCTFKIRVL